MRRHSDEPPPPGGTQEEDPSRGVAGGEVDEPPGPLLSAAWRRADRLLSTELGEEGLLALLRALPIGFVLLDSGGRVLLYNHEERRLAGGRSAAPEGKSFFTEVAPCLNVRQLAGAYRAGMEEGATLDEELEFTFPFPEGPLDVRIRMRRLDLGGRAYGIVLIDDNTKVKQVEKALAAALEQAREQALKDPLTGLFNRRHLVDALLGEVKRASRLDQPLSLLILDLDRFKATNDQYGHLFGDEVLSGVADALHGTLRSFDVCVRWGGEEFCAVLPGAARSEALAAAGRLSEAIHALRFPAHPDYRISVSIGVTSLQPAAGEELLSEEAAQELADGLLQRADDALYAAKRAGRDRSVFRD